MESIGQLFSNCTSFEIQRYEIGGAPKLMQIIKELKVNRSNLINIISIRYQVAHYFVDLLKLVIAKINADSLIDSSTRKKLLHSVEVNLADELGLNEKYSQNHRKDRQILLNALGIDVFQYELKFGLFPDFSNVNPIVKELMDGLIELINLGAVEALVVLWYYENRISLDGQLGDYCLLLKAFEKCFPEFKSTKYNEGDVLWHLASHARHDIYHAELVLNALRDINIDLKSISVIIDKSRFLVDRFWCSIDL